MFDIAWSELMLVGAVALVVIGPKDLPKAMRTVGQTVGKIRRMAGEFQGQFNEAMREAELHDLKKQVEDVGGSVSSAMNPSRHRLQADRDAQDDFGIADRAGRSAADRRRRCRDEGGRGRSPAGQSPAGSPSRCPQVADRAEARRSSRRRRAGDPRPSPSAPRKRKAASRADDGSTA